MKRNSAFLTLFFVLLLTATAFGQTEVHRPTVETLNPTIGFGSTEPCSTYNPPTGTPTLPYFYDGSGGSTSSSTASPVNAQYSWTYSGFSSATTGFSQLLLNFDYSTVVHTSPGSANIPALVSYYSLDSGTTWTQYLTVTNNTFSQPSPAIYSIPLPYNQDLTLVKVNVCLGYNGGGGSAGSNSRTFGAYDLNLTGTIGNPPEPQPTISPISQSSSSPFPITLSDSDASATLCYTQDGTMPTAPTPGTCGNGASSSVPASFTVSNTETVQVIATRASHANSINEQQWFVIGTPAATPAGGTFLVPVTVTLSCPTFQPSGSLIYYTLDGTIPNLGTSLTIPDGGTVAITTTEPLNAFCALNNGLLWPVSQVLLTNYVINPEAFVTVSSRLVMDADGILLANGKILFTPTNNQDQIINAQAGGNGGQINARAVTCEILNGQIGVTGDTCYVPNTLLTSPSNLCLRATWYDQNNNNQLLGYYKCLQPTVNSTDTNHWCTNGNCNFDLYQYPQTPGVLTDLGNTGPQGPAGNSLIAMGPWNGTVTYPIDALVTYSSVAYVATAVNLNDEPDTNPGIWMPLPSSGGTAFNGTPTANAIATDYDGAHIQTPCPGCTIDPATGNMNITGTFTAAGDGVHYIWSFPGYGSATTCTSGVPFLEALSGSPNSVYACINGTLYDLSATGGGTVLDVFGRTGHVVAVANDYNFNQLAGSAACSQLPGMSGGDITSSAGSCSLNLPATAISAGTYAYLSSVTFDSKGRATAATAGSAPINGYEWITALKLANYTTVSGDWSTTSNFGSVISGNCSGACTITLPSSATANNSHIRVYNYASTTLSVSPNGLQLNGSTSSISLPQYQGVEIWSDGSNYHFFAPPSGSMTWPSGTTNPSIPCYTGSSSWCSSYSASNLIPLSYLNLAPTTTSSGTQTPIIVVGTSTNSTSTSNSGAVYIGGGLETGVGGTTQVSTGGAVYIVAGANTGTGSSNNVPAPLHIDSAYRIGTTNTTDHVEIIDGHNTIDDQSVNTQVPVGVLNATDATYGTGFTNPNGGAAWAQILGYETQVAAFSSTAFVNGDRVCTDPSHPGYVIDNGTTVCSCPTSMQVGIARLTGTFSVATVEIMGLGDCAYTNPASKTFIGTDSLGRTTDASGANAATATNLAAAVQIPTGVTIADTGLAFNDSSLKIPNTAFVQSATGSSAFATVNSATGDSICNTANQIGTCVEADLTKKFFVTDGVITSAATAGKIDGTHRGLHVITQWDAIWQSLTNGVQFQLHACSGFSGSTCTGDVVLWSNGTASAASSSALTSLELACDLSVNATTATTVVTTCTPNNTIRFTINPASAQQTSVPNGSANWVLIWSVQFTTTGPLASAYNLDSMIGNYIP